MKTRTALLALALVAAAFTAQAMPTAQPGSIQGEVLETRDVEGYTYLRLKTGEGEIWAAVPTASVKKGAQVTLVNPALMQNFESKTLKKTFDKIVFAQLAGPGALQGAPQPAAAPAAAAQPMPKVAKATGPGAKTVAEVFTGKSALKDKAVVVRGQVVKVNLGIMGKNWVHLRDGSGSATDGSNDILVTTKDAAAVGDVVTAKGTVRTDVTVGPGYAYAVLIEDAALRK
jgi:hypothetical protein